jgi:hypothetical protein
MQRMKRTSGGLDLDRGSLPFPKLTPQRTHTPKFTEGSDDGEQALAALADVSRRIDQLDDEGNDLPRAA